MKTILFDLYESQPVGSSKFHGGGEYIKALYKCIFDNFLNEIKLLIYYDDSKFIDEWIIRTFGHKNITAISIHSREQIYNIFNQYEIDKFYSGIPYYYKRELIPESVKVCGTIHGLRDIEKPCDRYAYLYYSGKESLIQFVRNKLRLTIVEHKIRKFGDCIRLLDEIVCDSIHTKYSLLSTYCELSEEKIKVFYPPAKYVEGSEEVSETIKSYGKYILLLGGNRWIKNLYRACITINELFSKNQLEGYKVVVVGGMTPKICKKLSDNDSRFIVLEYVAPVELENLYKQCDIFVYPSLNEGFGLPPLEAMKYGKTCVVAAVCSLPEICGEAVYYVNPYDTNELKIRILTASENKIREQTILQHMKQISDKQTQDIFGLCKFIVE